MSRIIPVVVSLAAIALGAGCSMNPASLSAPGALARASCGTVTVQTPITAGQVLSACGQPSYRDAWGGAPSAMGPNLAAVEEWYYNTGATRPVQVMRFFNGRLVAASEDGLGFAVTGSARQCESGAVTQGLSKYRLVQVCGEPLTRQAYIVDSSFVLPNSPAISQGTAMFQGQAQNGRAAYREELAYKLGGAVQTVTVENGRVLSVGAPDRRG